MAIQISERFEVDAPVNEVWEFLIDPRRVVVCLPGAEVTDVIDERSYEGRVTVKVGPVTAKYRGTVRLEEAEEGEHRVRLDGEGKETGGTGSAKMSMTGRLHETESGATQVHVDAAIDVAGKMARFGRGVMEDVARQLFREFAENTKNRFEVRFGDARAAHEGEAPAQPSADTHGRSNDRETAQEDDEPARATGAKHDDGWGPLSDAEQDDEPAPPSDAEQGNVAPAPLRLGTLLFRAVRSRLKRFFEN